MLWRQNLIDKKSKDYVLDKLLNSQLFNDREIYKKLLKYIVNASSNNITPKETVIAAEVFGKGVDFNASEDTTVRVHMHNLRKMLDEYYRTEGDNDKIKIQIPKGHYRVKLIEKPKTGFGKKKSRYSILLIVLVVIQFLVILHLAFNYYFLQNSNLNGDIAARDDVIWHHFFNNGFETSVVIGDFLVFHEYNEYLNRVRRIQDYEINLENELDDYIKNNPNLNIENWSLGEIPHNSIFNLVDLQPVIMNFRKKFDINFTTEIDINFIKNRNIIYIGEFKNLRVLSNLILNLPIKYETLPWWHGKIQFKKDEKETVLNTSHNWDVNRFVVDLGLVAKLPGQNNENYIFFAGFGYNAQIKIIQLFSQNSSLNELEKNIEDIHGYIPDYFAIVFEIKGFDRASTTADLKFFTEIKEDYYQNY